MGRAEEIMRENPLDSLNCPYFGTGENKCFRLPENAQDCDCEDYTECLIYQARIIKLKKARN